MKYKIIVSAFLILWLLFLNKLFKINEAEEFKDSVEFVEKANLGVSSQEAYEILFKGEEIGFAIHKINETEKGYLLTQNVNLSLKVMGKRTNLFLIAKTKTDKSSKLRSFRIEIKSDETNFNVLGSLVSEKELEIQIQSSAGINRQKLKLNAPPVLDMSLKSIMAKALTEKQKKAKFNIFNPQTLKNEPILAEFKGMKKLLWHGEEIDTYYFEVRDLKKKDLPFVYKYWLDHNGVSYREETPLGVTLIKAKDLKSVSLGKVSNNEFLDLVKVKPKGDIDKLKRGSGFYYTLKSKGLKSAGYENESFEYNPFAKPEKVKSVDRSFLDAEVLIQSEHPVIKRKAEVLTRGTKGYTKRAAKIIDFVFKSLAKTPSIGLPNALEVLQNRKGDCNEHAVLTVALLRAALIPSRIVVGLVYQKDAFYYHAWVEYLSEDRKWVSADPAFNQIPSDHLHIPVSKGSFMVQNDIQYILSDLEITIKDDKKL